MIMAWTNDDVHKEVFPEWTNFWVYDYHTGDYVRRSKGHICGDEPLVPGTIEAFLLARYPRKRKKKAGFIAATVLLAASGLVYTLFPAQQTKQNQAAHKESDASKVTYDAPLINQSKSPAVRLIEDMQNSIVESRGPGAPSDLVVEDDSVSLEVPRVQESTLEAMLKTKTAKEIWLRIRAGKSYTVSDFSAVYEEIQSQAQAKREFIETLVDIRAHDARRVVLTFLRDSYQKQERELFIEEALSRVFYTTINDADVYFADDVFEILYPLTNGTRVPCEFAQSFTKEQRKAFGTLLHQAYKYKMQIEVFQEQWDHVRRIEECRDNDRASKYEEEQRMYEFFNDRVRLIEEKYAQHARDVAAITGVTCDDFSIKKSE